MAIRISCRIKYLALILVSVAITADAAAQHMEEIRKALYPKFNVALV